MKAIGTTRASVHYVQQNTLVECQLIQTNRSYLGNYRNEEVSMSKALSVITKSLFQKFIACVAYLASG